MLVVETYNYQFPKFEVDINPTSLCLWIISTREKIAWYSDRDLNYTVGVVGGNLIKYGKDV